MKAVVMVGMKEVVMVVARVVAMAVVMVDRWDNEKAVTSVA